jgi:hypothetical protein
MGRPVISLPPTRPQPPSKPAVPPIKTPPKPTAEPAPKAPPIREALDALPEPVAPPATTPVAVEKPAEPAPVAAAAPEAKAAPVQTPPPAETPKPEEMASAQTPVKPAAEQIPIDVKPVEAKPPVVVETTPPAPVEQKPASPVEAKPPAPVQKPVETKPAVAQPVAEPPQPSGGGAGKWIAILLLVLAIAGAAYYFLVFRPAAYPPAISVKVSVAAVADAPRVFPSPVEVKKAEPQTLKLLADGKVTKVVAENDEVAPDTVLVVLDSQAKLEKELATERTKIEALQKKAETAKGKAKQTAQTNLEEKQAKAAEIESQLKKIRLVAQRPGVVAKVLVKVGEAVTAGGDAVAVTDKALAAELKVPALEAQGMKVGQDVKLSAGAAGAAVSAQIVGIKTEGDVATLTFSLPLDTSAKAGDKLSLQRGMLEKVVRLPATAIVDGNKVYVMQGGKAAARQITVADRDGDSVFVQGLSSGDQVITSPLAEIKEGTAVQLADGAPSSH